MRQAWLPKHLRAIAKQTHVADQVDRALERGDYFDVDAATRAIQFFPTYLVHVEGEWAGKPFELELWQELAIWTVYGWKRIDGTRKFRRIYVEIPRKNGKSSFGAGIELLSLFADNEPGAQCLGAAYKHEQSGLIFRIAALMVRRSPRLARRARVIDSTKRILEIDPDTKEPTGSYYAAIPGEEKGQHGFNGHAIVFDELHEMEDRELHDVLDTSSASRRQPVFWMFSTAGVDTKSLQGQEHDRAMKAINGTGTPDRSYLAIVFALTAKHDWHLEKNWELANPGLRSGIVKREFIRDKVREADEVLGAQAMILRLHFNIPSSQHTRAVDMAMWDAGAGYRPRLEELRGKRAYLAVDAASTTDLTAAALVFPPDDDPDDVKPYRLLVRCFIPKDTIEIRSRRDRVPYDVWAREGEIEVTEGNALDYKALKKWILAVRDALDLQELSYDRWGMTQLAQELDEEGIEMVPIGQGFQDMSWPTKEFLRLVAERRLEHGGDPVLRWQVDNLVLRQDPAGNLKPDKDRSSEKIDGVVAAIMAAARAVLGRESPSVYKERGLLFL